jgi:hypothetical protein
LKCRKKKKLPFVNSTKKQQKIFTKKKADEKSGLKKPEKTQEETPKEDSAKLPL